MIRLLSVRATVRRSTIYGEVISETEELYSGTYDSDTKDAETAARDICDNIIGFQPTVEIMGIEIVSDIEDRSPELGE